MAGFKNIIGERSGMLSVIDLFGSENGKRYWVCLCDCGNIRLVSSSSFNFGRTQSCGCYRKPMPTKHGFAAKSARVPEYSVWQTMIQRCTNPNSKSFPKYGGRGIYVCKRWIHSFPNFIKDMGRRPSDDLSLERKDNNKGYSPSNCKWATCIEQSNNTRSNRLIVYNGKLMTLIQVSRATGILACTLYTRIRDGIPQDEIYTKGKLNRWRHHKL